MYNPSGFGESPRTARVPYRPQNQHPRHVNHENVYYGGRSGGWRAQGNQTFSERQPLRGSYAGGNQHMSPSQPAQFQQTHFGNFQQFKLQQRPDNYPPNFHASSSQQHSFPPRFEKRQEFQNSFDFTQPPPHFQDFPSTHDTDVALSYNNQQDHILQMPPDLSVPPPPTVLPPAGIHSSSPRFSQPVPSSSGLQTYDKKQILDKDSFANQHDQLSQNTAKSLPASVEAAQNKIQEFLTKRNLPTVKSKALSRKKQAQKVQIPEVKLILHQIESKILEFQRLCSKGSLEPLTNEEVEEAHELKNEITELKNQVDRDNLIENAKLKQEEIAKKRARLKEKKKRLYQEKEERKKIGDKKHREIDEWLQERETEERDKKRELELKKIADETLEEVRKKITEARRALELVAALERYRVAKKATIAGRGGHVPKSHDALFESRVENMKDLMQKQLETYEGEERTLKVMLETENDVSAKVAAVDKTPSTEHSKLYQELKSYLFGEREFRPADQMYQFFKFFNAAEDNFEALIQIRSLWDKYLVDEAADVGSSIPVHWVEPSPPSSEAWQELLKPPRSKSAK